MGVRIVTMPLSSSTAPTDPLTERIAASLRERNRLSAGRGAGPIAALEEAGRRGLAEHAPVVRSDYVPRTQEVQASIYQVLLDRVGDILEEVAE